MTPEKIVRTTCQACDPPYEEISGNPILRGLLCKIYKVVED